MTTPPTLNWRDYFDLELRVKHAKDDLEPIKALAEQDIIAAAPENYGKNEKERERYLTIHLLDSTPYQNALGNLRSLEMKLAMAKAETETWMAARRAHEFAIRQQIADALTRRAIPQYDAVSDGMDEGLDEEIDRLLYEQQMAADAATDDDDDGFPF